MPTRKIAARRNEHLTADLSAGAFEDALAAWKPGITPKESLDRRESAYFEADGREHAEPITMRI